MNANASPFAPPQGYLSVKEFAARSGVNKLKVEILINKRQLPCWTSVTNRWYVHEKYVTQAADILTEWLKENARP